jgi:diguanylate cyclase (GGDEF)-like protein
MIDKKENIDEIIYFLKKEQRQIVKLWVNKGSVKQILSKYSIGQDSFSSKVAVKILDYFIEVLQQQKPVGHCPVMNDFIDFMFEKKITIKEIFLICMGLRRAIFSLIESVGKLKKDKDWVIEIFSELFDQNLSGVLEHYENLLFESKLEQKNIDTREYEKRLQSIIDLQDGAVFEIEQNRLVIANHTFYEMVGVSNQGEFMRIYPLIWSFIESVDSFDDLFESKRYDEWLEKIVSECGGKVKVMLFDYSINQKVEVEMSIYSTKPDIFAVALKDVSKSDEQISSVLDLVYTDELTQVPNIRKFDEVITLYLKKCKEIDKKFFLFLIDIHNLSEISEVLGRNVGDSTLKKFAKGVLKHLDSEHFFARIDGNRFAILSKFNTYDKAESTAKKILYELHSLTYSDRVEVKGNIAIVSCQPNDTIDSMMERADRVIQRIVDYGSNAIMDDRTIIEEDKMTKTALKQFLAQCKHMQDSDDFLEIVNYFMEVPIESKSKIVKIDNDTIVLKLRKVAIHAINKNSHIYIRTKKRPHFKAYVKDLDREKLLVKLEKFKPILSSPLDRKSIRVKLMPTIEGVLKKGKTQILVEIDIVSVDSFSLTMVNVPNIKVKDTIEIETVFRWDGRMESVIVSGVVSKIKKRGLNVIIEIDLKYSKAIEDVVSPYIAYRQLEIIKQLRETIL